LIILAKKQPSIDLFLGVKDLKVFHRENMAMNKTHYTYMARMTKGRVVFAAQAYAAKAHFNYI
jgi:hypothetical protein